MFAAARAAAKKFVIAPAPAVPERRRTSKPAAVVPAPAAAPAGPPPVYVPTAAPTVPGVYYPKPAPSGSPATAAAPAPYAALNSVQVEGPAKGLVKDPLTGLPVFYRDQFRQQQYYYVPTFAGSYARPSRFWVAAAGSIV